MVLSILSLLCDITFVNDFVYTLILLSHIQDQITPECSKKIGYHLWDALKSSKEKLCESFHRYQHSYSHLLLMENVSITSSEKSSVEWDTPFTDSELQVHGDCSSSFASDSNDFILLYDFLFSSYILYILSPLFTLCSTFLLTTGFFFMRHFRPFFSEFVHTPQRELNKVCKRWNDSPLFVLPWFDSANWWHFVELAVFQTFLHLGVVQVCTLPSNFSLSFSNFTDINFSIQLGAHTHTHTHTFPLPLPKSELLQDSRDVHIAILRWPSDRRPNTREKGVYPTWVALPEILEKMFGPLRVVPLSPLNAECFRRVAWVSNTETYLDVKRLNDNLNKKPCFSSILRSAADVMRSVMGVPHLINPNGHAKREVRVVYMKRDNSAAWTNHQAVRSIANQDQLVEFIRTKCLRAGYTFEALEFYYRDMKNAREQVTAVGEVNVMIGVHGAGW